MVLLSDSYIVYTLFVSFWGSSIRYWCLSNTKSKNCGSIRYEVKSVKKNATCWLYAVQCAHVSIIQYGRADDHQGTNRGKGEDAGWN